MNVLLGMLVHEAEPSQAGAATPLDFPQALTAPPCFFARQCPSALLRSRTPLFNSFKWSVMGYASRHSRDMHQAAR